MRRTAVRNKGLAAERLMNYLWQVAAADLTHGSRMHVRDGKFDCFFAFASEEECDLRHEDLFSYLPEEVLKCHRTVRIVRNEGIYEV